MLENIGLDVLTSLTKYATPEVGTVIGSIVAAWVGWKTAGFIGRSAVGLIKKASFVALTASILAMGGVGSFSVGLGELFSRVSDTPKTVTKSQLSDQALVDLAERCKDKEVAKLYLEHIEKRNEPGKANREIVSPDRLATLVEKTTAENKDAVILLLKIVQEKIPNDQFVSLNDPSAPEKTAKNSKFSLHTTMTLLGCGIASCVFGGLIFFRKPTSGFTVNKM